MAIHFVEQFLAQVMTLQQMPEVKDARFIGKTITQTKPRKATHRFNLVESISHRRIAQVVEQLHTMNAQHRRDRVRLAAPAILWLVGLYLLLKSFPGDQLVHLFQKFLAFAPFVVVFSF